VGHQSGQRLFVGENSGARALIPVGRMGTAAEVTDAVTFLAGEAAGFVTGEVLDVNGGAWCD
jgi:3-oxoacyl-[acyl-carrier protein] reductase